MGANIIIKSEKEKKAYEVIMNNPTCCHWHDVCLLDHGLNSITLTGNLLINNAIFGCYFIRKVIGMAATSHSGAKNVMEVRDRVMHNGVATACSLLCVVHKVALDPQVVPAHETVHHKPTNYQ
jgi:hypothetical protein